MGRKGTYSFDSGQGTRRKGTLLVVSEAVADRTGRTFGIVRLCPSSPVAIWDRASPLFVPFSLILLVHGSILPFEPVELFGRILVFVMLLGGLVLQVKGQVGIDL